LKYGTVEDEVSSEKRINLVKSIFGRESLAAPLKSASSALEKLKSRDFKEVLVRARISCIDSELKDDLLRQYKISSPSLPQDEVVMKSEELFTEFVELFRQSLGEKLSKKQKNTLVRMEKRIYLVCKFLEILMCGIRLFPS